MNTVPLSDYIVLSLLMFCIGAIGVIIRRSPVVIFMCIELMLNSANLAFLSFARYLPNEGSTGPHGQIYIDPQVIGRSAVAGEMMVIFVMAVAAAEVAVGLGIIMAIFRLRDKIDVDDLNTLKG